METIKLSEFTALGIMAIGVLLFQLIPRQLLSMFNATDRMMEIGVPALRIISISFLCAGFCVVLLSVFQAFGEGILSLIVSATRQLVMILPVAYVFAKLFGLNAVWWAFPIAEIASVSLCILFLKHLYNKKIKMLD